MPVSTLPKNSADHPRVAGPPTKTLCVVERGAGIFEPAAIGKSERAIGICSPNHLRDGFSQESIGSLTGFEGQALSGDLLLHAEFVDRIPDRKVERLGDARALGKVIHRARFHHLDGNSLIAHSGEHHNGTRDTLRTVLNRGQDLKASHIRKAKVYQDTVRLKCRPHLQCRSAIHRLRELKTITRFRQVSLVKITIRFVILDDQHFEALGQHSHFSIQLALFREWSIKAVFSRVFCRLSDFEQQMKGQFLASNYCVRFLTSWA